MKMDVIDRITAMGEITVMPFLEYLDSYHPEHNDQGLANQLIQMSTATTASRGAIRRRARPGGTLNFCTAEAA